MKTNQGSAIRRLACATALIFCGWLGVFSPSAHAQRYMFGRADFATGTAPQSVATGDLNHDGIMDLAVTNRDSNTVSILLGKTDGTFAARADYPVSVSPHAVVVGDFNGDGNLDLAVVNYGSSSVSILLGNGSGGFQAHVDYAVSSSPVSIVAGDFNRDGRIDLAVANSGANTVSVLLGNGDGTFKPHVDYATGPEPSSVTTADFNADGKLDLVLANANCPSSPCGPGSVSVLLGNGDGTFQGHTDHATGVGPSSVASADFNGDGNQDLAVANSSDNTVSTLLGNGDGTFQAHADTPVGSGPDWVTVSDFNRDGRPDLAVVNQTANTVSILLGNGDGTWQPHWDYYVGSAPRGIAVADFNGDGPLDVAVPNGGSNTVSILLGKGDGALEDVTQYPLGNGAAISITAADFNHDGILDLAVANQNCNPVCQAGPVSILLGKGDGTFEPHVDYATGNGPTSVITGDFNRDGNLDVALAAYNSNTVSVLLGNGDGTFRSHVDFATGQGPLAVTAGDFNGDGIPDLALAVDSMFAIADALPGNGDGTFQPATSYRVGTLPRSIVAGDFNGDGRLDLAVTNKNDNTVSILLGIGNGTFQAQVTYPTGNGPFSVVTADFNGDGKLDLATANQFDGSASVLLGNGDGTFKAPVNYPAGLVSLGVTTGDFNGDGHLDLAVASGQSQSVSILLGNGDGTFQPHIDYGAGPNTYPYSVVKGDFTGVGGADVATATEAGVSVILNSPVIAIFPRQIAFASQAVGTTSAPQTLTLTNPSFERLDIVGIVASGDFAESNTCGSSLAIGATCTVTVTFTPTTGGARSGAITFTDGAASSPQTLSLSGTGLLSGPGASLSPSSLSFPSEPVGTTSPVQTVTLQNSGNASLSITAVSASGDFAQSNNCGSAVAAGASCTLSVTFTPTSSGTRTGALSVTDNAAGSPQSVSLSGSGNVSVASLSPTSLTFGSQSVGTTSGAQTVTLTNTGGAPLNISGTAASGDFAQTNTCGSSVAAGTHCTINVTFTPTAAGTRTGTVTITDNASGSPQTVGLTGSGTSAGPAVSLSPSSLSFPSEPVGTTSPVQTVTLQNSGNASLSITAVSASGDFAQSNNCGSSVAAGASCTLSVTFTPTSSGTRSGALSVTDNAAGSPQSVSLTGSGTATAPTASLSPSSLTFAAQAVGTASSPQAVTLSNTGNATLSVTSIAASGDFAQTNTCGSSVAAGTHCSINVTFTPTAAGTRTGTVTITDNASGSPQTVGLTGSGTSAGPAVSLSPSSLSFPSEPVGTTSPVQTVTLQNSGNASLSITAVSASGDFAQSNNCGSSVATGASCTLSATFTPTVAGARTGTVTITDNASGSPQTVGLTGSGTATTPTASLSPSSLTFAAQAVGTASSPQAVTLSNTGNATLSVTSIAASGDFAQTNTCGSSVAAGTHCALNAIFTPTASGTRTGAVTITDNASGSPQTVGLTGSGTATAPTASLSSSSVTFAAQAVGTASSPQAVTLSNTGNATLSVTSIGASGDFAQTNTCGASVLAGAHCTISVTFAPTMSGTRTGTLTIADNATGSPQAVSLSGSGTSTAPLATFSPASLSFGNVAVGTISVAQVVTLANPGTAPLTITSISVLPQTFTESDNCGSLLAAGASCSINTTLTPTAFGNAGGALFVADNAGGGLQAVSLTGAGSIPAVSLTPTGLAFVYQPYVWSPPRSVTLTNIGGASLVITGITTSPATFVATNNWGTSLAPNSSCTVNITLSRLYYGATTVGTLRVDDNATGSPHVVGLAAAWRAGQVSLSASGLSFGNQSLGVTSAAQAVTVNNIGVSALGISSIATNVAGFAETNDCPSSLAARTNCTINVSSTPAAFGPASGMLSIVDSGPSSPEIISLVANGTGAAVIFSASSLTFGSQLVGSSSAPQTLALANVGSATLSVTSIAASGDFAQSNNCGASLASGASCLISVTFTPTATGTRAGTLSFADNAGGSPQTVTLIGTGQPDRHASRRERVSLHPGLQRSGGRHPQRLPDSDPVQHGRRRLKHRSHGGERRFRSDQQLRILPGGGGEVRGGGHFHTDGLRRSDRRADADRQRSWQPTERQPDRDGHPSNSHCQRLAFQPGFRWRGGG